MAALDYPDYVQSQAVQVASRLIASTNDEISPPWTTGVVDVSGYSSITVALRVYGGTDVQTVRVIANWYNGGQLSAQKVYTTGNTWTPFNQYITTEFTLPCLGDAVEIRVDSGLLVTAIRADVVASSRQIASPVISSQNWQDQGLPWYGQPLVLTAGSNQTAYFGPFSKGFHYSGLCTHKGRMLFAACVFDSGNVVHMQLGGIVLGTNTQQYGDIYVPNCLILGQVINDDTVTASFYIGVQDLS